MERWTQVICVGVRYRTYRNHQHEDIKLTGLRSIVFAVVECGRKIPICSNRKWKCGAGKKIDWTVETKTCINLDVIARGYLKQYLSKTQRITNVMENDNETVG